MKRMLCVALSLLLLAGGLAGCAVPVADAYSAVWLDVFDTVTRLTVYGVDKAAFDAGAEALHARLMEYHQLFDIYHAYAGVANLKTVNDRAGQPVAVTEPVLGLLEYGLEAYTRTGGRVNILFGAVLTQWHACRQAALQGPGEVTLPAPEALQQAAAHTDPSTVVIDREAGTVCLTDPASRLDVGAVAKGYATELVSRYAAEELGWTAFLLDVGGNVRAVGGKPTLAEPTPFTIGVQNPDTDSAVSYVETVKLQDAAAVTSGDYQRFFTVEGERYAHIIDPDTLHPARHVRSVTVMCADSGLADVLSTALFTLPVEAGLTLLQEFPDAEAVWVLADGTLRYSPGFGAYTN